MTQYLDLIRGLVRPLVVLAFTAAIIGAVFDRLLPPESLLAAAGPVLGFWFSSRSNDGQPPA